MCLCVWLWQHKASVISNQPPSSLNSDPHAPSLCWFPLSFQPLYKKTKRSRSVHKLLFRVDQAKDLIPSVLSALPPLTSVLGVSREENIDHPGNNDQLAQLALCLFSCPFPPSNQLQVPAIFPCLAHEAVQHRTWKERKQTSQKQKKDVKKVEQRSFSSTGYCSPEKDAGFYI